MYKLTYELFVARKSFGCVTEGHFSFPVQRREVLGPSQREGAEEASLLHLLRVEEQHHRTIRVVVHDDAVEYRCRTLRRLPNDPPGLPARAGRLPEVQEGEATTDDTQTDSPRAEAETVGGGSGVMLNDVTAPIVAFKCDGCDFLPIIYFLCTN